MTEGWHSAAAYEVRLDRLLMAPVRLFIVTMLADRRWHRSESFIRGTLRITGPSVSKHLRKLRQAGYVETRRDGLYLVVRLTPFGGERLTAHLEALQDIVTAASVLAREASERSDQP